MFRVVRSSDLLSTWQITHTGSAAPDGLTFSQRAGTVGPQVASCRSATILVTRTGQGPQVFLAVPRSASAPALAGTIASAVGGRHEGVEGLPVLDLDSPVVQLVARPSQVASHETQAGRDPSEVARLVARSMPEGMWLAATMRAPGRSEYRRVRAWFRHRLPGVSTHYSATGRGVLVSFLLGGSDLDDLRFFGQSLMAALPGFDLETEVVRPRGRAPLTFGGIVAAGLAGGGVWYWQHKPVLAVAAAVPGACAALAAGTGLAPSEADRIDRSLSCGRFCVPRSISGLLVRPPRSERVDAQGRHFNEQAGSYPLDRSVFFCGPEQVTAIASPHFGVVAGASSTQVRSVPPALLSDIGPIVGYAGSGGSEQVRISSGDMWSGVLITGVAGTGKTIALHNLFAAESLDRVHRSGRPGRAGSRNALVAFENKGADGVRGYLEWLKVTGDPAVVVDLADPGSAAIDLLPTDGTAAERAAVLVDSMVYAFGENAIAHRSQNTLRTVFTVSLLATAADVEGAKLPAGSSFMNLANVLLGGLGDQLGKNLSDRVRDRMTKLPQGPERAELFDALSRLEPLYGPNVSFSARRALCEAPQSKVAVLSSVSSWWSPARSRVDFGTVLDNHWAVIVNTGSPLTGGLLANEAVTAHLSAMLMHNLRRTIAERCTGWRDQGRSVTVFSDELALLAGNSPEVIKWLRNQGRSFGVRLVLATQYPEQLHPEVRTAVMSFGTKVWFQQSSPDVIRASVDALNTDGSEWMSADLSGLEPYHAIVQVRCGDRTYPAVALRAGYWDEDRAGFVADQGYAVAL